MRKDKGVEKTNPKPPKAVVKVEPAQPVFTVTKAPKVLSGNVSTENVIDFSMYSKPRSEYTLEDHFDMLKKNKAGLERLLESAEKKDRTDLAPGYTKSLNDVNENIRLLQEVIEKLGKDTLYDME